MTTSPRPPADDPEADPDQRFIRQLGALVRRHRQTRKFTQARLAELAGVGRNSLSGLELGVHAPNVLTIRKLAAALGIAVTDLIPADDAPERQCRGKA